MFSVIADTAGRLWLLGLLVIWAALLFGGFLLGKPDAKRERRMPVWTRMASSLTLVIAGWSWFWLGRGNGAAGFALLIAVGMTLGLLGDLAMAELLPIPKHVLGGIAAFGLGHIAYIAAAWRFGNAYGLDALGPRLAAWGAWLLIGLGGWYLAVFRGAAGPNKPGLSSLHWAALPYALLLASTAGLASGLALQNAAFWSFAFGAGLFLLSDLILAAQLFNGLRFKLIHDVIWLAYGPGQMLIVYAVGSALRLAAA